MRVLMLSRSQLYLRFVELDAVSSPKSRVGNADGGNGERSGAGRNITLHSTTRVLKAVAWHVIHKTTYLLFIREGNSC